jgi:hypothetical protein
LFWGTGIGLLHKTQQGSCEVLVKTVVLHILRNRVYAKKRNAMKLFSLFFLVEVMGIRFNYFIFISLFIFYDAGSNSDYTVKK